MAKQKNQAALFQRTPTGEVPTPEATAAATSNGQAGPAPGANAGATNGQGTGQAPGQAQATGEGKGRKGKGGGGKPDGRVFATADEARAAGAAHASQRLWAVSTGEGGATVFVWALSAAQAIATVARGKGWQATHQADARSKAAAALAALSPEERAALLAQFAAQP